MPEAPPSTSPTVAVDLRALVPTPTGIGVYTRSLLLALAERGSFRYLGLSHAPQPAAAVDGLRPSDGSDRGRLGNRAV